MQTVELIVRNESGLHARPAALFVKAASGFRSRISVENVTRGTAPADAKSIVSVLWSGLVRGHVLRLTIEGEDEDEAAAAMRELVQSGLGEPVA